MSERTVDGTQSATTGRTMRTRTTVMLWVLVGVAFLFSFASLLSIGLLTMPMAIAGAVLLLVRADRRRGWAIMLVGVAIAPLPIVWYNRDGPGLVCRKYPPDPADFCSDQVNPWPWLAFAVLSFAAGATLFFLASRRDTWTRSGASAPPDTSTPSSSADRRP